MSSLKKIRGSTFSRKGARPSYPIKDKIKEFIKARPYERCMKDILTISDIKHKWSNEGIIILDKLQKISLNKIDRVNTKKIDVSKLDSGSIDFVCYGNDVFTQHVLKKYGIDVERKDVEYKSWYETEGVDFLENKILKYSRFSYPVYYAIMETNFDRIFAHTVEHLLKYGKRKEKNIHGQVEYFRNLSLSKLYVINIKEVLREKKENGFSILEIL